MSKLPLLWCALLLLLPGSVFAASFDPSLIVSDAFFNNSSTMDVQAIQHFLERRSSILASAPSNRLGAGANGRSAARIIFDAAQNVGGNSINPQVLLVTLQKEQSLITRSSASNRTLDQAMGYGCPDGAGCAARYGGFTNQVTLAGSQFARNFSTASRSNFPPGKSIGMWNETGAPNFPQPNQSVWIGNAATSALYQYTPHVYNGNRHFWLLTQDWFSQADQPYLAQAPGTAVYYVTVAVRHRLAGAWLYPMLTLPSQNIRQLSREQLFAITNGPGIGVPSRDSRTNVVFLVSGGRKWSFPNATVVADWGFSQQNIERVDLSALSPVPEGGAVGLLQKNSALSATTVVLSGKRFVASAKTLRDWGLQSTEPVIGGIELGILLPFGGVLPQCVPHDWRTAYLLSAGRRYDFPAIYCKPVLPFPVPLELLPPVKQFSV